MYLYRDSAAGRVTANAASTDVAVMASSVPVEQRRNESYLR